MAGLLTSFFSLAADPVLRIIPAACFVILLIFSLVVRGREKYLLHLFLFFFAGALVELSNRRNSELAPLAERQERLTIEGTILEPPVVREEAMTAVVRVDRVQGMESGKGAGEKLRVNIYRPDSAFAPGDRILFPARLRAFQNFNNPGCYDYRLAMEVRGFSCAASVGDGGGSFLWAKGILVFPLRCWRKRGSPFETSFHKTSLPETRSFSRL